jgi:predicted enzyme related to lactoylglutathione lyase
MNKVVHFEIPADDLDRAKKFYSQLFGWHVQDWPLSDGSVYVGARTVEVDETTFVPKEPGAINGGIVKRDTISKTPQVTVNVPSIDDYLKKVNAAGGGVLKGKTKIEDMGYYAYISDTEGNLLGLWEDIKRSIV